MSLGRGASLGTPDQGWAWVVLVAVVLSQGMTLGFPSCIGVFYTDIQTSFQATNSETSWFPSIVTAVLHAGGPLCSILVECYGCRVTVLLGGLLASVGMVSSSFSQTILQLYLTAGFIAVGTTETTEVLNTDYAARQDLRRNCGEASPCQSSGPPNGTNCPQTTNQHKHSTPSNRT